MQSRILAFTAFALATTTGVVAADVLLKPSFEYDDFFEACRGTIKFEGDAASIAGVYSRDVGSHRWACAFDRHAGGGGSERCEGEVGVKYQCADVVSLKIHALRCQDEGGAEVSCGAVSVAQDADVEVSLGDDLAVEGARLLAVATAFDDFMGKCEIDFAVSTPYPDGKMQFDYVVSANGEAEANVCEWSVFANGGGGGSCSGVYGHRYGCPEIESLKVSNIRCVDEADAERDCGAISYDVVGINGFAAE